MSDKMITYTMQLVRVCGQHLRTTPHTLVSYKKDFTDLVTDLDSSIEQYLVEHLKERYPKHTFLCEEREQNLSDHTWIIDPIDGTTNFVNTHRDFAISIAYYHKKKPLFGIVYDVMRDEMFLGITGKGAWLNDKLLPVLRQKDLKESIIDIGMHAIRYIRSTYQKDITDLCHQVRAHRALGCASLSIVHIAQGLTDLYISSHVKCWDYAAAIIILEEVCGSYSIRSSFFTTESSLALFANRRSFIEAIQKEYLS